MEAWETCLAYPRLVEGETFLRDQLWDQSQLDLLGFSQLQRAYFGLSGVSYRIALSGTSRSAINEVDATGRTVLSWASQKGDDTTVAELLTCGADPNITDYSGVSSLHNAVLGFNENCVRLLLASKAELEVKDSDGRTPLALAATHSSGVFNVLLEFGADMETQDHDWRRPIHIAVKYDKVQHVRHLRHAGADMFARNSSGLTVLDYAIYYNVHSSLRVLLEASARPTTNVPSDVHSSYPALYADQKTLEILHSAVLRGFHLKVEMEDKMDIDVVAIAEWRRDKNQDWSERALKRLDADPLAWFHSFELLLQAINRSQSRISEVSDDERQSQPGCDAGVASSDTASDDETEDEKSGKDAHPQPGHDAGEEPLDIESDDEIEDEESWEDARES